MKQFGIRFYILFNIIIICTVGIFLFGIISLKVTEQFAIQGKIEGTKSLISAFESAYYNSDRIDEGIEFLNKALDQGAWGMLHDSDGSRIFKSHHGEIFPERFVTESELNLVRNTGESRISVVGSSILPYSTYRAYQMTVPVRSLHGSGAVFIYQPLYSFQETITRSQKLLSAWITLFILVLAIFGYYLLSSTVVRPFQRLSDVTRRISKGSFPYDMDPGRIYEIRELFNALRNLHDEIESGKQDLEKNIKDLETANSTLLKTQKELIASEKLASLGRLSAGVAHEIGNPLSAISGYIDILKKTSDRENRQEYFEKISAEIERISIIIKTLLDYSKPREYRIEYNDINEIINDSIRILKDQGIMKNIRINTDLYYGELKIRSDRYQMLQVFVNIFLNSRDFLNQDGVISVSSYLNSEGNIQVDIKDNGPGIPEEDIEKIFDPFYTTKAPGKGVGLGLSICQRVVEQFNGSIFAKKGKEDGSEFSIIFSKNGNNGKTDNTDH